MRDFTILPDAGVWTVNVGLNLTGHASQVCALACLYQMTHMVP